MMKRWKLFLFLLVVALLAIAVHLRMTSNWPYPVRTFEVSETKHLKFGGDGFHYIIPHNTGDEIEDPNTGCPCFVIFYGWSSYANYTNALAHGVKSLYEEYKASPSYHGGLINLNDFGEFEQKLINKWNLEVKE